MLRSKKMLALMTAISGIFVNLGNSDSSDRNGEEKELLCNVLVAGERILKIMEVNNDPHRKTIEEAIYGSLQDNYQFDKHGGFEGRNCGIGNDLRNQLCIVNDSPRLGIGKEGCFAESVIGTFYCLCTPGGNTRSSNIRSLCGVSPSDYGNAWWGSNSGSFGQKTSLFASVWQKVIQNCTDERGSQQNYAEELKKLREAVGSVGEKLEGNRRINKNLYYLGGNGQGGCSGSNRADACAGYQKKSDRGNEAYIPWADKIYAIVKALEAGDKTRQPAVSTEVITRETSESAGEPSRRYESPKENIYQTQHETKGLNEHKNESRESSSTPSPGDSAVERKSRKTRNIPQEFPHLASELGEESSLITRQKWLFLAVVFN